MDAALDNALQRTVHLTGLSDDECNENVGSLQMHQHQHAGAYEEFIRDRIEKSAKSRGLIEYIPFFLF